jgi:hypothetical protein
MPPVVPKRHGPAIERESRAPLVLFIFALCFFSLMCGFLVAAKKLPPYTQLRNAFNDVSDLAEHWRNDLGDEPTRSLVPAAPDRPSHILLESEAAAIGHRFVSGLTAGRDAMNGAILFSRAGEELHYWPIDYSRLDPKGLDPENVFLHGIEVFRDGTIVVNFDGGKVLAKLDACGESVWTITGNYHHVVFQSYDGTIWTWEGKSIVQIEPDTGDILKRIDLRDDIIKKHQLHGLFSIRADSGEVGITYLKDAWHPNDVDVLGPEMAAAFPMFDIGDILISLRSLNLVAVLDANDYRVKWSGIGPWHRQHDPDFLADGTISVYNNNMGLGRSNIIKSYPESHRVEIAFQGAEHIPFYSWQRGKHEYLENGNILVTEAERGRAFEVDGEGKVVWDYHNVYDDTRNGVINKAMLLPTDYFELGALECKH